MRVVQIDQSDLMLRLDMTKLIVEIHTVVNEYTSLDLDVMIHSTIFM